MLATLISIAATARVRNERSIHAARIPATSLHSLMKVLPPG
jgi:hypothetical protein